MELICPLCGELLIQRERALCCCRNHSFDIARQGYVNLLTVQQKHSLNPGDTREQVLSRREFLDGGFYAPIRDALCRLGEGEAGPILDVGCGEGYYSTTLAAHLQTDLVGLDISKEAVRWAAARHKNALWLCASAAHLPVESSTFGMLTSLFALTVPGEFHRVLKPGGAFIQVLAAEDHLLNLKRIIYPTLTHREKNTTPELPGFQLEKTVPVRFPFTVTGQQVQNLLSMTPHVYRIGREGAEALKNTSTLTDEASCVMNLYRRGPC